MSRPHIEFFYSQALPWTRSADLAGRNSLPWKLLSADDVSGELSAFLQIPSAFHAIVSSRLQEEIYVLDGTVSLDGAVIERDGYARISANHAVEWSSTAGAVVFVCLNLATAMPEAESVVVCDTTAMAWDREGVPVELAYMGIGRKALYVDADTGLHRTWLLSTAPQTRPRGDQLARETHGCAEELLMLSGEITGPQGVMRAGAYFWRPKETLHGPFGTREGNVALCRFRNGPQTTEFHDQTVPFEFDAPYRPTLPEELQHLAAADHGQMNRY